MRIRSCCSRVREMGLLLGLVCVTHCAGDPLRPGDQAQEGPAPGQTRTPATLEEALQTKDQKGPYHSFRPGLTWYDAGGAVINAHGGGFYFENGTYYWFGEHKATDAESHDGFHVYTSKDLYNWTDAGIAFAVAKQPKSAQKDIQDGCIMERPKVIYNAKTKKYVMWFHLELKGQGYNAARAAVAVSDSVTGPYLYQGSFRPNGAMSRDQTLFVDDDGKAYQFTASEDNKTMHINELADDYLKPSGKFQRVFVDRSMEAPAVFKHEGKYYFIGSGCTGWDPNAARSAVADHVTGPWTELDNPAQGPGADKTFFAQSTYVLPVAASPGKFIFIADRWNPKNLKDSRYIFLPLTVAGGKVLFSWRDEWDLSAFP